MALTFDVCISIIILLSIVSICFLVPLLWGFSWGKIVPGLGFAAVAIIVSSCYGLNERSRSVQEYRRASLPGVWLTIYESADSVGDMQIRANIIETVGNMKNVPKLSSDGLVMLLELVDARGDSSKILIQDRVSRFLMQYAKDD